jgi:hypothetical protein
MKVNDFIVVANKADNEDKKIEAFAQSGFAQ